MNQFLRHIAPFILLVSYLPTMLLSSIHVHHDTIDADDNCLQCVGHIETAHHHDHDCIFCSFLSLNYIVPDKGKPVATFPATEHITTPTPSLVPQFRHGVALLRAPPIIS